MTKAEICQAIAAIEFFMAFVLSYFGKKHELLKQLQMNLTSAAVTLLVVSLFVE